MPDHKNIYIGIAICSIISIWAIVFINNTRSKRSRTEKAIDQPQIATTNIILPDQIQYQRAKQLLAQNKVLQAIQSLPNDSNADKKNQAILRSYLAEQEIQKDTLTGRQQARAYTEQANTILQNMSDTESIQLQEQNQATILATCIQESQAIADYRPSIIQTQYNIQITLASIAKLLAQRTLPAECKNQLSKNIQTNQSVLESRIQNSKDKQRAHKQINRGLITTLDCNTNIIPQQYQITQQAKEENDKYLFAQQTILQLLQQNPNDLADKLCQGKNDSQLDNQLSQTMQELLGQSESPAQAASSNQIQYQDIDQDIQTIIQETQGTNTSLIQSIQKTIHDTSYDPIDYIQKLFQEFFGNTKDFISP